MYWCPNIRHLKNKRIAYLQALITYGKVFDLTPENLQYLVRWKTALENRTDLQGFLGENNAKKITPAIAINSFCKYVEEKTGKAPDTIRTSRMTVINRKWLWDGERKFWTGGTGIAETIICVRPHAISTHIKNVTQI
jgi:hypothetical protein